MSESDQDTGVLANLRRLLDTLLRTVQVRLALIGNELEQEKLRLFDGLVWAGLALLSLGMGALLLAAFVVILFWDTYRLQALGILAILFLGVGVWLLSVARARLRNPIGLFKTSVEELGRDRAALDHHQE